MDKIWYHIGSYLWDTPQTVCWYFSKLSSEMKTIMQHGLDELVVYNIGYPVIYDGLVSLELMNCCRMNNANLRLVCQMSGLKHLNLNYLNLISDLSPLVKLRSLKVLRLAKVCNVNRYDILDQLHGLIDLSLSSCDGLRRIPRLNLKCLVLERCQDLVNVLEQVNCLEGLVKLKLRYVNGSGSLRLNDLKELELDGCPFVTDQFMACLKMIPLVRLVLRYVHRFSGKGLKYVRGVDELVMDNCGGIKVLPKGDFRVLSFNGIKSIGQVDSRGWEMRVENSPWLTMTPVGYHILSVKGCVRLEHFIFEDSLVQLDVSRCSAFGNHELELVNTRCCCLRKLAMSGCPITKIVPFMMLEELDISYCRDIRSFQAILLMDHLQFLDMSFCQQLRSLDCVEGLMLRYLELRACIGLVDLNGLLSLRCLEKLNLLGCHQLGVDVCNILKRCSNLRWIMLSYAVGFNKRLLDGVYVKWN